MKYLEKNKGITLIALIVTIVVLLILAGITISSLTGSDSAPAKANEANQKNAIGAARDDVYLTAQNAQMEAYQIAYVENGVSAGESSTTVGTYVSTKLNEKYGTDGNFKTGLATITATTTGNIEISTTDFVIEGNIADKGGNLTWGEIELNVPRISGVPSTYELNTGESFTIPAILKGTKNNIDIEWSSSNDSIATVTNGVITAATDLIVNEQTVNTAQIKITASATGCESKECIVTVRKVVVPQIGDIVTYTTKLNNTELTMDWKIFYKEKIDNKNYIWLILEDYLPNSYINLSNISPYGEYAVNSSKRTDLLNAISTTSNWNSLLKGVLNGHKIDYTETEDTNIKALGSPTLELWRDSWNFNYPNTENYTTNQLYITSNETGYLVSRTNNPPTSSEYDTSMVGTEGYSSNVEVLYFPHTTAWNSANGYWLAAPSAKDTNRIMDVDCSGSIRPNNCFHNNGAAHYALRPVICLPASDFE